MTCSYYFLLEVNTFFSAHTECGMECLISPFHHNYAGRPVDYTAAMHSPLILTYFGVLIDGWLCQSLFILEVVSFCDNTD